MHFWALPSFLFLIVRGPAFKSCEIKNPTFDFHEIEEFAGKDYSCLHAHLKSKCNNPIVSLHPDVPLIIKSTNLFPNW